jgi:hypothetical protein
MPGRVRFLDQVPVGFYDVNNTDGGGTPGGPIGSIQYNDAGVLNGSANLLWNSSTNTVTLIGTINATNFIGNLQGTSSWAVSASQALTASYAQNSQTSSLAVSSSYIAANNNVDYPLAIFNGPTLTQSGQSGSGNFIVGISGSRTLVFNPGSGVLSVKSLYTDNAQLGSSQYDVQTLYGNVIIPTGSLIVTGSINVKSDVNNIFLIKNQNNVPVFTVSQSGIIVFSTQSTELTSSAPNGGIYFTSQSFYIGLD